MDVRIYCEVAVSLTLGFNSLFFLYPQGLTHFDEILQVADGIILSRGNLGIDLPPEKVNTRTSFLGYFILMKYCVYTKLFLHYVLANYILRML